MYKHKEYKEAIGGQYTSFFFPSATVLTFAIELAFKNLLLRQGNGDNDCLDTHNLYKLFTMLNGKSQNTIIQKVNHMESLKINMLERGSISSKKEFMDLLKNNKNRFQKIRYYHEGKIKKCLDIDFLEALLFALAFDEDRYEMFLRKMLEKESISNNNKNLLMIFSNH